MGTYVYKLVGTTWVQGVLAQNKESLADVKPVGNADVVYAALYGSNKMQLVQLEYRTAYNGDNNYNNYVLTSSTTVTLSLGGTDTATIDIDSRGHMWVAYDTFDAIEVRYSLAAPYTTWSSPTVLAGTNANDREISALVAFDDKIGVMWSDHHNLRWGFRYHVDADDASAAQLSTWSADETPGLQTDPTHPHNVGNGMADDHLNIKAAADGTIYAAIKTAYDIGTKANAEMAFLTRTPAGVWGPVYGIDGNGTRPVVQINEVAGFLRYIYAGETGINDIVYKDIPLSAIDPSQPDRFYSGNDFVNVSYPRQVLIGGGNNKMVSGTKQPFAGALVIIATRANGIPYSTNEGTAPFFVVGAQLTDLGQYLFYNNSQFDNETPEATAFDDAAIAVDKRALLPGGSAAFDNYSSFSRGINGIMIDLPASGVELSSADLQFRIGNDNAPAYWPTAPAPASVSTRLGAGVNGANRVTIIWPDGAIKNTWLQITVLATAASGLSQPCVFYFGHALADSGNAINNAVTNASDEIGARNNVKTFLDPAAIENVYDYNRDRLVNAIDQILARSNLTTLANSLKLINLSGSLQMTAASVPVSPFLATSASPDEHLEDGWSLPFQLPSLEFDNLFHATGFPCDLSNGMHSSSGDLPCQPSLLRMATHSENAVQSVDDEIDEELYCLIAAATMDVWQV